MTRAVTVRTEPHQSLTLPESRGFPRCFVYDAPLMESVDPSKCGEPVNHAVGLTLTGVDQSTKIHGGARHKAG
jgi:hypothetical protein